MDRRIKSGKKLKKELETELKELGMEKAKIEIEITQDENLISPMGQNHVEFLISANPGLEPRSIRKVASGGEISRIMLAFKCIFAQLDEIDTLIFDEIDTGISGRTAQFVAEKILKLSRKRQVTCITHLPQIVSVGDCHFLVEKNLGKDSVDVNFTQLDTKLLHNELARMLGGAVVTEKTIAHAQEMLEQAEQIKATQ